MKKFVSTLAMMAMFIIPMGAPAVQAWTFIPVNTIIKVVTPVSTPTIVKTPSMVINSTKPGTLEYPDECVSNTIQISADQDTTITFNQLDIGVYDSCRIILHYTEFVNGFFQLKTSTLYVPDFEIVQIKVIPIDNTAPTLTKVTDVPTPSYDNTPNYSFISTEAGNIAVDGACSSTKTDAIAGTNPIEFNTLAPGTYSNCTITVTDTAGNTSNVLAVNPFTIQAFVVIPGDTTAPSLDMISPVATPTTDTTPNLTFSSTEAGTITYTGSCASDDVTAVAGNNTITLKNLAVGTYNNCSLRVTDLSTNSNVSAWLSIPSFTITSDPVNPPVILPTDYCAGFTDVSKTDSDCDAITYVKSIGAMTGNPNGTFEPASNLQRDQVAKISLETYNLFNAAKNYCSGNPFPDVTTNAWSYQYICRGVELGMITGYASGADTGYYRPARSVNRVEFLALILRNLNETMPSINSSSYKDVEIGQWYSGYAKYSYDNSLFTGASLYPDRFVTRREVARAIYQLHELNKI